jgi:transposase
MIRIKLSKKEKGELERYRGQASSKNSEKALMAIMSDDGAGPREIAQRLRRNPHTVRMWLSRYRDKGVDGFTRLNSPGRPNKLREGVKSCIEDIIKSVPTEFGYQDSKWTIGLMAHHMKDKLNIKASTDTVERALKDMNYTYKRISKTTPKNAPSKEEKVKKITKMVNEILDLAKKKDCEIFALDESHFSTDPYVIRGWGKKRWTIKDTMPSEKRQNHVLWMLESSNKKILLEKIENR